MSDPVSGSTSPAPPWPGLRRGLVAILRGLTPDEAPDIAAALLEAGFEAVEVPLNSPDPFVSIERIVDRFGDRALVGAGTVLTPAAVEQLAYVGGKLLVAPNVDPDVLRRAGNLGLVTMPGVFTASEALLAIACGASALKFFPATALGPAGIKAISAVLPPKSVIGAVGGVSDTDFADYAAVGVRTFGLGSSLYAPGLDAGQVHARAVAAIAAYDAVFGTGDNDED